MATKRKQSQAQRRRQSRGGVPGWLWMLGGFLPGAFLAVLVHLHHERQGEGAVADALGRPAPDSEAETSDAQRPRFEFYKLLSEMEVVVPEDDPAVGSDTTARIEGAPPDAPVTGEAPATSSADDDAPDSVQYMVQAGSFRNHGDADRLKARLALLGVEAEIQSVRIDGGDTWHRVRIGPMDNRQRVEEVRQRLQEERVESILLRLQG